MRELLQTEQDYVKTLGKICETVYPHAKNAKYFPPPLNERLDIVFSNIRVIYEFHRDALLPDLESTLRGEIESKNFIGIRIKHIKMRELEEAH